MASYKKPYSSQSDLSERSAARYKSQFATTQPATPRKGNPNWNGYKKKELPEPGSLYRPVSSPSSEQSAIFDNIVGGEGSLMVSAYAGCGKTTTVCEAMHRVNKQANTLSQKYIVFASKNQAEAVGKCPQSAEPQTAHSFGLRVLANAFGYAKIDKEKTDRIALALVGPDDEQEELRDTLSRTIDLAKDYLCKTQAEVDAVITKHAIDIGDCKIDYFTDKVLKGIEYSVQQKNIVSFSDMIFLPLHFGLKVPTFDLLYVDEAQDLNKSRQEIVMRALGSKGRLIAVGDQNQAIFGFSGADRQALDNLRTRSKAHVLPLHKTFRCGRAIVALAQQYVADYEAAETNPEGEVVECGLSKMLDVDGAMPGDFVLSRTNAPLIKIAMRLLKESRRCNIQGKDIGKNLLYMIKRSGAKDVVSFQSWLDDWANAEIERLTAKRASANVDYIIDRKECLENFCEGMRSLEEVKRNIADMFSDKDDDMSRVMLATIHASKGLERDRVWLLESYFNTKAKTEEEIEAERNVKYVAITRARESLFQVVGKV